MHLVDPIFILLLFVVQPIHGVWATRRYYAGIEAGEPANVAHHYKTTMLMEWLFLAALALAWYFLGRPIANLGFVAPGGSGFWIGTAFLVLLVAYLVYSWNAAKHMSDDEKAKQIKPLGKLVHLMPHTRHDLRHFINVSITAGIVEEIVYRGFVLWYLALFMPLWGAVIVSSVAFGLAHSYQGASNGLRCGLVGLVFAILYVVTGSIWLPILGHALLDILQGAMLFEMLRSDDATPEQQAA